MLRRFGVFLGGTGSVGDSARGLAKDDDLKRSASSSCCLLRRSLTRVMTSGPRLGIAGCFRVDAGELGKLR